MRASVEQQLSLVPGPVDHPHAEALELVALGLDRAVEKVGELVQADLTRGLKAPRRGRRGMSGRQVLAALVIKQMNGFSYEELGFHLADSDSYRRLAGYGVADRVPSPKTLQRNIKKLRPETLELINRSIIKRSQSLGVESGERTRSDCTVTESNIHPPTDSSLLDDCVRVLTRLLHRVNELTYVCFTDHTKRARRRAIGIQYAARKKQRRPLYADLIKVAERTARAARRAVDRLASYRPTELRDMTAAMGLRAELKHYLPLVDRVIDQATRRVLKGESVPAAEKLVSIFEPHTDIIRKDRRDTYYGHKLCLTNGPSGLFIDCVIEDGNPADSTLTVRTVERQREIFGRVPKEVAFDGGFASKDNLADIKEMGVEAVSFSKRRGLAIKEMVGSTRLHRILKNFRAGVEAWISFLKRSFGLRRCIWRGLSSFKTYVWGSVIAANLLTLARHQLE